MRPLLGIASHRPAVFAVLVADLPAQGVGCVMLSCRAAANFDHRLSVDW